MAPTRIEYSELSSPDPLADSLMEEYASQPSPTKHIAMNTNRQRRRKSSDITIKSSKVIADQGLSPWRIKVTVEAEHEEGDDTGSGAGRKQTITRTMKVPLRDAGSPTKSPKKSNQATKGNSNEESAPSARKPRTRRKSIMNLSAVVLGDDDDQDEWTATPRSPRKGSRSNKVTKKPTASSQRSVSDDFEIRADESNTAASNRDGEYSRDDTTPEVKEVDLNQVALRTRSNSAKQKHNFAYGRNEDIRKTSFNSTRSYPTPSPTASEFGRSDDIAQDPSTHDEVGLDTVMESEGFTMIDLESLPSVRQMRVTPDHPTISEEAEEATTGLDSTIGNGLAATEAPSIHLSTLAEDSTDMSSNLISSPPDRHNGGKKKLYSIGHLQLPSSTNVHRHRHVTPMLHTSPSLPSPPQAPASLTKERSPANSGKAMVAGLVLQDAVTPEHSLLSDHQRDKDIMDQEEDAMFGGFSPSTRRELRAELRFGEELGKRQFNKQDKLPDVQSEGLQHDSLTQPQVWRSETTVQHAPPVSPAMSGEVSKAYRPTSFGNSSKKVGNSSTKDETRWEARARKEREEVIESAKANEDEVLLIDSDRDGENEESGDADDEPDETMGDIWLAEARNHSSSPRDTNPEQVVGSPAENPRRKLIPSPWKRGERIDLNSMSQLSGNESFTGILFRDNVRPSTGGFGAAIVANPDKALRQNSTYDRRTSGEFIESDAVTNQARRLGPRQESYNDDQDIEDENFDGARDFEGWRDASDVVEEETDLFEAEHKLDTNEDAPVDGPVGATTRLYETNLDNLSEQDLSSSPHIQLSRKHHTTIGEHDSTYSSLSERSTDELYRQRNSLSPSKERPKTPRSALKGGRTSFGAALSYETDSQEAADKKVVWAKRMSCMNEEWEESSRSIRSTQESFQDDTPTPLTIEKPLSQAREQHMYENSIVVNPQPPSQEQAGKAWFSWFKQANEGAKPQDDTRSSEQKAKSQSRAVHNLDGSIDSFIEDDRTSSQDESSYVPTSRQTSIPHDQVITRAEISPPSKVVPEQQSQPQQTTSRALPTSTLPSYLLPPSYPSDPIRNPSLPLPTSGPFTTTHFKTLHIIYRKSLRPRFHAPLYPTEIRPSLLNLALNKWTLTVDETETMDEEFEFKIGEPEVRILERFMREVEHGYSGKGERVVEWGWSVEELARKLARIAIGEVVRGEEKEARRILKGKGVAKAL